MPDIDRLNADTGWIDLGFVERERTPRKIIEMGIRHHLAGLSLSNTVILLEDLGVERSRTAIHDWVQKANLQPKGGESPDRVAVDQKAIQINDEQYWLYAAVDPETNRILHSRLFPTYTIAIAREFLTESSRKTRRQRRRVSRRRRRRSHRRTPPRRAQLPRSITRLQEPGRRVFREVQRRTSSFSNCFSHVDPATAETWLQAHAVWWNHVSKLTPPSCVTRVS